jgi:hypothetical protein
MAVIDLEPLPRIYSPRKNVGQAEEITDMEAKSRGRGPICLEQKSSRMRSAESFRVASRRKIRMEQVSELYQAICSFVFHRVLRRWFINHNNVMLFLSVTSGVVV